MREVPERIWIDGDETGLESFLDWSWQRGSWNRSKEGVGEVEYIRADLVPAPSVTVKPLEWSPVDSWKQYSRERAPAFGGEYQIVMLDPGEDELPSLYFEIGLGAFMFRFEQDQDPMGFPGDTSRGAPASEVVACRCTVTFEIKRDGDGNS